MELDVNIKDSLLNLEKSLDALDNALLRQANGAAINGDLNDDLDLLTEDRSRLAGELDDARARIHMLENVNDVIEQRIDVVMADVAQLIDNGGA